MAAVAGVAGRSPSAVRVAKQLINRLSNAGAAEHFATRREIIFGLIDKTPGESNYYQLQKLRSRV